MVLDEFGDKMLTLLWFYPYTPMAIMIFPVISFPSFYIPKFFFAQFGKRRDGGHFFAT
jgi:hypothetical protein